MDVGVPSIFDQFVSQVHASAGPDDPLGRLDSAIAVVADVTAISDRLLDHFVAQSRQAGCSWTDIGARLGVSKQAARQRFAQRTEPVLVSGVAQPTPRLQICLERAATEAQLGGAEEIDAHHLLTGLLAEGVAAAILERVGVTGEAIREAAHRLFGLAGPAREDAPPMSQEATDALAAAARQAVVASPDSPYPEVRTEHLLSVLVSDPGSRARRVLNGMGTDIAAIKRELDCYVAGGPRRRAGRWKRSPAPGPSCSFCGRSQKIAGRLVAGPGVHICAACVDLAGQVLGRNTAA
jgi:ATP-dependent Clp protease ATP-binding subunit ClpA